MSGSQQLILGEGAGGSGVANYIEDVFSTWLYTGNGSTQTITNGIDLSTKGGLIWMKSRSAATDHYLNDTGAQASYYYLSSNSSAARGVFTNPITYSSTGFAFTGGETGINTNGNTYVSWTFRKQPKFFDVVTYTGNGVGGRTVAHALGSAPGAFFIKATSTTGDWLAYCRTSDSGGNRNFAFLRLNTAAASSTTAIFTTSDIATAIPVNLLGANTNGVTYVMYLFAHNAGGFGLTGTDNVISCGSFTTDANGDATVNLGYEPQWILTKSSSAMDDWELMDSMRGMPAPVGPPPYSAGGLAGNAVLRPNLAAVETSLARIGTQSTGFVFSKGTNQTYIYIAIRRGPMKTPTTGTSVFSPIAANNSTGTKNTTNFPVDLQINTQRTNSFDDRSVVDRLRGVSSNSTEVGNTLYSNTTGAEFLNSFRSLFWDNTGFQTVSYNNAAALIYWNFRRAPGFFDEVCYEGTGTARTVNHNLGAVPELMVVKRRNAAGSNWGVYAAALGATKFLALNTTAAEAGPISPSLWNDTAPTASVFSLGTAGSTNASGGTYVAYLFASCPGVSKVGNYTGNGTSLTVNCGFTGGARFVLIKRTNATGDWVVFDSARGIVAGNDPFLELNTTAAEQTGQDAVDADSTGFIVNQTAENLNVSGGQYIYLAIA